ncbi:unnamed protein product [Parnassius apollo]|uniref:(apollo) hypothetical protein n=1 Tax=Parnassius apollo TaxID=110799 RepID=A0A8S3VYG3_PARAO|nr:unnamed protein product [Parnassius apollo]
MEATCEVPAASRTSVRTSAFAAGGDSGSGAMEVICKAPAASTASVQTSAFSAGGDSGSGAVEATCEALAASRASVRTSALATGGNSGSGAVEATCETPAASGASVRTSAFSAGGDSGSRAVEATCEAPAASRASVRTSAFATGNSIQKKWKNMKDCFVKELAAQQGKSGQAASSKKKKYIHFDSMLFLIPSMQKRETRGNLSSPNSTQDENASSDFSTQGITLSTTAQNSQLTNNNRTPVRKKNCSRDNNNSTEIDK